MAQYPRLVTSKRPNQNGIVQIPKYLYPMQNTRYPIDNAVAFERWYMDSYLNTDSRERIYLPIQWTALYCNGNFGKDTRVLRNIQEFINALDATKKYYTIVQYDDGILNDISQLDIKVCAMSGPRIDYPLPLLCQPHKFNFDVKPRDIFASFVGSVTHEIRANMIKQVQGKANYYISTKMHNIRDYCHILARSKYALCPRGYGQSSFRIQESIEYGAVPIYISDEFILPYDERCLPVLFDVNEMKNVHIADFLKYTDVNYNERLQVVLNNRYLFTYTGCKQKILEHLSNENAT